MRVDGSPQNASYAFCEIWHSDGGQSGYFHSSFSVCCTSTVVPQQSKFGHMFTLISSQHVLGHDSSFIWFFAEFSGYHVVRVAQNLQLWEMENMYNFLIIFLSSGEIYALEEGRGCFGPTAYSRHNDSGDGCKYRIFYLLNKTNTKLNKHSQGKDQKAAEMRTGYETRIQHGECKAQ